MEDADVFSLFQSDFVTADHVITKDDSIGRYAEQLSDHARHHAGTIFFMLSWAERTDVLKICLLLKDEGN